MPSIDGGVSEFLRNISEFSLNLIRESSLESIDGRNTVLSTFSTHSGLSLVYWGARYQCAEDMARALSLTAADPKTMASNYQHLMTELQDFANCEHRHTIKIFMREPFQYDIEFVRTATEKFKAEARYFDSLYLDATISEINSLVAEITDSKVVEIVNSDVVNHETDIIIVIGSYFKGTVGPSLEQLTICREHFHASPTQSFDIDMLSFTGDFNYAPLEEYRAEVVELPLGGRDLSLQVFLPLFRFGLENIQSMAHSAFHSLPQKMTKKTLNVRIPIIKTSFHSYLEKTLDKLGMKAVFSEYADLAYMMDLPEALRLSLVAHKTVIELNTDLENVPRSTDAENTNEEEEDNIQKFVADRPFLFVVKWNKYNLPLFMGTVHKPID